MAGDICNGCWERTFLWQFWQWLRYVLRRMTRGLTGGTSIRVCSKAC
ncbi:hypothetical protein CKA32_002674 [Geitlerinema sp. FC II]|nr:hypothetical protein CKA32_002674 [Geitlerinema sp. FC II]